MWVICGLFTKKCIMELLYFYFKVIDTTGLKIKIWVFCRQFKMLHLILYYVIHWAQGGYRIGKTSSQYNHWLAALVKGKCSNTKPTYHASGVVCHHDAEQNRSLKIAWPCWELNCGPIAPQTLPVYHTTNGMKRSLTM